MAGWQQNFPNLVSLDDTFVNDLMNSAATLTLPDKAVAFHQGDACSNYLLILAGQVKVMTRAENGREIVLYRLGPGDSCILTTSCLFGNRSYPAEGVTESEVTALAIPAARFHEAVNQAPAFREFVFRGFSSHLTGLIELVQEVAFGRLDTRLAQHLLQLSGTAPVLTTTHQQLATELGSAREVVSRQLKEFESRGWIRMQRGSIEFRDKNALRAHSTL